MTFFYLSDSVNLAISSGGRLYTFNMRGVKALVDICQGDVSILSGARVEDSVVGKAAALLMVFGGVESVKAALISDPAIEVFKAHGVACEYSARTPRILNRAGDGLCPMESAVVDIDDPSLALARIKETMARLQSK